MREWKRNGTETDKDNTKNSSGVAGLDNDKIFESRKSSHKGENERVFIEDASTIPAEDIEQMKKDTSGNSSSGS